MKQIKLNVKDKSVQTFLEERLIGYKPDERNRSPYDSSPYHLMQKEMLFKIDCGIGVGESVKIELLDRTQMSNRELKNVYIYKAEKYDDVAIKMVLDGFTIEYNEYENKTI